MRGLERGWIGYVALCAAGPLVWGLAVSWICRRRSERRRAGSPPQPRDRSAPTAEDYTL